MAEVSKTPANVAINAMQAIPFSSMIGGPLNACIEAQAMAARTSWEFIKEVGLNTDEKGQKSAVMVAFSFNRGGRMVQLNVPLLTIDDRPHSLHCHQHHRHQLQGQYLGIIFYCERDN